MSYCPKCRYEYEAGALICPDCNEALVDQLPLQTSAAVMPDDSWVVVGQVASQLKSDLAKGSLDSNNIPSMILSSTFKAHGSGLDFHTQMGISSGGNIVLVPREFEDEASLVLEAVLGDDLIQPNG